MILILDNRGLEPPQPMMRTLAALETLPKNETLTIINDRRPMFLFEQLDEQGYRYKTEQQPDGSFKIEIFR
jgi:tRNA 2-thiouridine synthesizing protein A